MIADKAVDFATRIIPYPIATDFPTNGINNLPSNTKYTFCGRIIGVPFCPLTNLKQLKKKQINGSSLTTLADDRKL